MPVAPPTALADSFVEPTIRPRNRPLGHHAEEPAAAARTGFSSALHVSLTIGALGAGGMGQVVAGEQTFDFTPDGRFLMIRGETADRGDSAPTLVLVQNWFEELKRLVPTR